MVSFSDAGDTDMPAGAASTSPEASTLDVPEALRRLGGRKALYLKALESFMRECRQAEQTVRRQMAAGEPSAAVRTLHKIKGTAATIGAGELASIAMALESSVSSMDNGCPLLADFKSALNKTMAAVGEYIDVNGPSERQVASPVLPVGGTDALTGPSNFPETDGLEKLSRYLAQGNMLALPLWERLKPMFGSDVDPQILTAFEQRLRSLDFDAAARLCQQLTEKRDHDFREDRRQDPDR